jgi:chromate reductase
MSTDTIRILGVSGSLRKGSSNTALLRSAIEIAETSKLPLSFTTASIGDIPLYDEDARAAGLPAAVARLREAIAAADALLIVTPEYNYSVPGVLKNAIDWASRPPAQPFAGKPVAIMGVSSGMSGTMRAQYHLRQMAVFLDMHPMNKPEVFVRNGKDAFDGNGRLIDDATRKVVEQQLVAFVDWIRRLERPAA